MFYDLTVLDSVRLNFSPAGLNIMNITLAFIAAWWGIWHILSGLVISTIWARKKLPETEMAEN